MGSSSMHDMLGLVEPPGTFAAELVAAALEETDAQLAAILRSQVEWLRAGAMDARRRAEELIDEVTDPRRLDRWRSQLVLHDVFFGGNLTLLRDGEDAFVWLYDDDIVTLEDGGSFDPAIHQSPWDLNTEANDALASLLASEDGACVRSIRLLVFEGTERLWQTLRDWGAQHLVTHLELRLQRASDEPPLAERFPELRGLACTARDLPGLLSRELPSLRSVVVRGPIDPHKLMGILARAPALRHLGLHFAAWSADALLAVLRHPRMATLAGLEVFHPHAPFPFEEWLEARDLWAHLAFVGLAGHQVGPELRARFADTNVTFVGHDRRETIALDFETHGWAETAR